MRNITVNGEPPVYHSSVSKKAVILIVFVGIVFWCLVFIMAGSKRSNSSSTDLNANVNFNGAKFVITNHDNFAYLNAKLVINDKYEASGINISPGEKFDVGVLHLTDSDGNRFGLSRKALKAKLVCENGEGNTSYYFGSW